MAITRLTITCQLSLAVQLSFSVQILGNLLHFLEQVPDLSSEVGSGPDPGPVLGPGRVGTAPQEVF